MAKKKISEEIENTVLEAPVVERPVDDAAVKESTEDQELPIVLNRPEQAEMPKEIAAYFQRHPEMKEAYVDKFGGVFEKNTPKVFIQNANLYQNPYFKQ